MYTFQLCVRLTPNSSLSETQGHTEQPPSPLLAADFTVDEGAGHEERTRRENREKQ